MKLNTTTVGIPLAIVLLVGAAGAVMATSGDSPAPAAQAPAAPTATPTSSPDATKRPVKVDTALTDALDALVAKGTITAAQKTAVLDAVAAEQTARLEARKAAMEKAKADWQQVKDFLADGVITKAEFDKLPADSYLRKLAGVMDDGKITTDELKALGRGGFFFGGDKGRGHGFGGGWPGKDKTPDAIPTPSAGTSG